MARRSYNAVGGKLLPNFINNTRVIIYDDNDIQYIVGDGASFEWEPQYSTYETFDGSRTTFPFGVKVTLGLNNGEILDNIRLDDTLMKRIAKFNKEQEIKRLDDEIAKKKEEIKEIESILNDRTVRLKKLKEFIANIYDMDIEDEDDEDWD